MKKWNDILPDATKAKAHELSRRLRIEQSMGNIVYPTPGMEYQALILTPPEKVKCVIFGTHPFYNEGPAQGLAYGACPNSAGIVAPTTMAIYNELERDIKCQPTKYDGDFTPWAMRGVLMLNLQLSCGKDRIHDWGWESITNTIFRTCLNLPQPIVFSFWGGNIRKKFSRICIDAWPNKSTVCVSSPAPRGEHTYGSAVPAFAGGHPFSRVNRELIRMGAEPIDWTL